MAGRAVKSRTGERDHRTKSRLLHGERWLHGRRSDSPLSGSRRNRRRTAISAGRRSRHTQRRKRRVQEKPIRRIGEVAVAAVMVRAGKIDSGVCHSLHLETVRRRCHFSELAAPPKPKSHLLDAETQADSSGTFGAASSRATSPTSATHSAALRSDRAGRPFAQGSSRRICRRLPRTGSRRQSRPARSVPASR